MTTRLFKTLISFLLVLSIAFTVVRLVLASEPVPEKSVAKHEINFMKNMVDQHMMAVLQAETCTDAAGHDELLLFCGEIIANQNQEMMMMQFWVYDWYQIDYAPETKPHNVQYFEMLEGTQFDIAFMQSMINHHRASIKDSKKCLDLVYHSELLGLCNNMIVTHNQEIQTMQTWLCEWYGICDEPLKKEDLLSAR